MLAWEYPNSVLPYFTSYSINYPTGYEGEIIPGNSDDDNDGLSAIYEATQGTSDDKEDTDGDGLDDFIESIWNSNREGIFCGTSQCAYPDPVKKDLYVEIDWIYDGTETYKPTSTQLGLVEAKFADLGIRFHADIGQFGGGNELTLSSYEASTDLTSYYYAYKWGYQTSDPANFDESRYRIWRYVITGYQVDGETWSGIAEAGGDDIFISFGRLEDNPIGYGYSDFDNAIAGTIVHELGHNLCLSALSAYIGQDTLCVHSRIDYNIPTTNYRSAMNYDYQFTNTYSYSDGSHGTGDHDDLTAVYLGINDFTWNDDDSGVGGHIRFAQKGF